MGYVPTHGPFCEKRYSYPTRCPSCRLPVVYFECTCGSKIFLVPGGSGETHECRIARLQARPSRIDRRTGQVNAPKTCPFCFRQIAPARYNRHIAKHAKP
jgi:hypothetical protein